MKNSKTDNLFSVYKDILWYLVTYLLLPFHKITFGLKIEKNKKVKEIKSGYVSVCNHVHQLDCVMVANALGNRRSYYPTLQENFDIPVAGHIVRTLGGIPIPTGTKNLSAFSNKVSQILKNNRGIHIFPEGELVPYCKELREIKPGAFHFAVSSNVPVVPLVITYRDPKGLRRITNRKPLLNISVLDPIFPKEEGGVKDRVNNLCNKTKMIMEEKIYSAK